MEHGCEIVEFGGGVYYIEGKTWFPTQIVVTDELDKASHIWVKGLSGNLNKEDFREMLDERKQMTEKEDRELADSVLEVSISANKEMVDELIGDESMYEALMEIGQSIGRFALHEILKLLILRDIRPGVAPIDLTQEEKEHFMMPMV